MAPLGFDFRDEDTTRCQGLYSAIDGACYEKKGPLRRANLWLHTLKL